MVGGSWAFAAWDSDDMLIRVVKIAHILQFPEAHFASQHVSIRKANDRFSQIEQFPLLSLQASTSTRIRDGAKHFGFWPVSARI